MQIAGPSVRGGCRRNVRVLFGRAGHFGTPPRQGRRLDHLHSPGHRPGGGGIQIARRSGLKARPIVVNGWGVCRERVGRSPALQAGLCKLLDLCPRWMSAECACPFWPRLLAALAISARRRVRAEGSIICIAQAIGLGGRHTNRETLRAEGPADCRQRLGSLSGTSRPLPSPAGWAMQIAGPSVRGGCRRKMPVPLSLTSVGP